MGTPPPSAFADVPLHTVSADGGVELVFKENLVRITQQALPEGGAFPALDAPDGATSAAGFAFAAAGGNAQQQTPPGTRLRTSPLPSSMLPTPGLLRRWPWKFRLPPARPPPRPPPAARAGQEAYE